MGAGTEMHVGRILHSLNPERCPTELNIPEFLLQFHSMWLQLGNVDNLAVSGRLSDRSDLSRTLKQANRLTGIIKV